MANGFQVDRFRLAAMAVALLLAPVVGCATLWPGKTKNDLAQARASDGSYSLSQAPGNDADEQEGVTWSDLSPKNIGKTAKRLTGNGPNKDLARQLYREADDLFKQAAAAPPGNRAHVF